MSIIAHALIVRHPNAPPAQLIDPQEYFAMPKDPRDPHVEDKYATPDSVARAKEAQLTERVRALNEVVDEDERDRLVALFVDDEQPEPAKRDMFDDLRDMYASLPEDAKREFCYDTMRAVAKARMLSVSHAAERVLGLL
jgi:predicted aminopeptidase